MITLTELAYLAGALAFVVGLKRMSSPLTARGGNGISAGSMLLLVVVTLLGHEVLSLRWAALGLALGGALGLLAGGRVRFTAMPETVALLNGFGGLASLCVVWTEWMRVPEAEPFQSAAISATVLIGGVTFSGSLIAWAKLAELMTGRPVSYPGQRAVTALLFALALGMVAQFAGSTRFREDLLVATTVAAFVLGILGVMPVGGADMPVVISLLNSLSGLAAAAAGFALMNNALIVTGALVGASGLVLTQIMCKSMNRSLANVLFAQVGARTTSRPGAALAKPNPISVQDAYTLLEAAQSVVIIPGYGLAVAQAQHALRELGDLLIANGTEVVYAIHPVAGRMPGHLNVVLSEANVPYDQLVEMESANARMSSVDVCLVVGANDIVNPAARADKDSPLFGMPILDADRARAVLVLKRSMAPGFAGVDNPLFTWPGTRLLFGDAKATLQALVSEFGEARRANVRRE